MVSEKFDLLILGAGLSGSISAWLAAREGLSVLLVDPLNPPHRLEGLSPRLHHWLQQQGLLEGIGDALLGPFERTSYWEKEPQTANQEWVVSRPALDFHLHRKLSEIPGVYLHQGSGRFTADGAMLANGNTPPSRYRIDARGRKAMPQRDEATQRGPATIAIGTYVKAEKARPGISIVPVREGWLWIVVLSPARIWVQFTTDARSPIPRGIRFEEALHQAGERLSLDFSLSGAEMTMRESAPALPAFDDDLSVIRIGDAAAANDPLSGQGQFWAVSAALAAAAARRTMEAKPGPESTTLAQRFLKDRTSDQFLRQARLGRDFYRLQKEFADAPFWSARRSFPDDLPAHEAITEIRAETGIVIRDGLLADQEVLITPASPSGIGWLGPVPAVEAWRVVSGGATPEELVNRWGRGAERLPLLLEQQMIAKPG